MSVLTPYTHESEKSFEEHVVSDLEDEYGEDAVENQVHLPDGRIADIIVDGRHATLCWELENDSGSLPTGKGQAIHYSATVRKDRGVSTVPVLCFPEGHIDEEERESLRSYGTVLEEVPAEGDTSGV